MDRASSGGAVQSQPVPRDLGLGEEPVHGQLEIVHVEGIIERGKVGHTIVGQGQSHVAVTCQ